MCYYSQRVFGIHKSLGNDLYSPIPQWNFPSLIADSKWFLCISRKLEPEYSGKAPGEILKATHQKALKYASLELLKKYEALA